MKRKIRKAEGKNYKGDYVDFFNKYKGKELEVIAVKVKETHYLLNKEDFLILGGGKMRRNVQTIDGKWQVLQVDTGGYYFYWKSEKYYLSGEPSWKDYRMRVVKNYEIVDLV